MRPNGSGWWLALAVGSACGGDRTWMKAQGFPDAAPPLLDRILDAGGPDASPGDGGRPDATGIGAEAGSPEPTSVATDPVVAWPLLALGAESRQFSSFDRTGRNDDGFSTRHSVLYADGPGQNVIFDALGPGQLNVLWFTSGEGGRAPLAVGELEFYLDDEVSPRAVVEANALFSGAAPGFSEQLVFDNRESTGGYVSFVPIPFARRLKITTRQRPYFYNAQYDTFPVDVPVTSWTTDADVSALARRFAEPSAVPRTAEEQSVPFEHEHVGSGTIDLIRIRLDEPSRALLSSARIRITWDDQSVPAVDCPLDMFFGSGMGLVPVDALAFTMDVARGELMTRFPMPFWSGFRLSISGIAGSVSMRIGPPRFEARAAGYFHAVSAREDPTRAGVDFEYLDHRGAGRLVGTVLTVKPYDPALDKQWWEGDLRSYADERRTPAIHGTGHEDDHLGGWSNGFLASPFTLPMHGEPAALVLDANGQYNGPVSLYRLWNGIPFARQVRHSVEHGTENRRAIEYASTTFFYGTAGDALRDSDQLVVCDAASRAEHAYVAEAEGAAVQLDSPFEGREYRTPVSACHQSHTGVARFELDVAPENRGVYLRRLYDQAVARQRATVHVDGELVGDWYTVEGNTALRHAERDYFLPGRYTAGKTRLSITLTPRAGGPAWYGAEYRALSVVLPE